MKQFFFYFSASRLPVFLAVLFVIQNQFFNSWVHLSPNPNLPLFLMECFTLGILLYGPGVLFGIRTRYLYFLIISLVVSAVFISQYLYFSFYGGFLQASAWKYAGQLGAERSTLFTLFTPRLFVFLLNIFAVIIAGIISWKGTTRETILRRKEKTVIALAIAGIAIFGYGSLLAANGNVWVKITNPLQTLHDLNGFAFSANYVIEERGIANYYFGDIIGMLLRATPVSANDTLFVQNWFSQKPDEMPDKHFGAAKGKNLIIIQVESLESAVVGQKIDGMEITPNLNRLSKEGLYFNNYYTQVGPGNTADAEFVTLNSLYPLTNTVAFIDFANNKYTALPELLKQNGYRTYALHGDFPSFWNRANIYPALGYEQSISKKDFTAIETGFETLPDDDFFSQSLEKISAFPKPFMATLITLTSHTPFIIPEAYQKLSFSAASPLSDTQKNYLESVHYTDGALGEFIAGLKKTGLYDDSLIAIYGDHGSFTGVSEQVGSSTAHTLSVLRPSQVPLIIIVPKSKTGAVLKKTLNVPGSHLDFYPTIAALLGITPPKNMLGQDLLATKTPVITRRDPYSQIITAILTPELAYEGAETGIFEEGRCLDWSARKTLLVLPVSDCKKIYDQQLEKIKVSDLIVKGNLIPQLLPPDRQQTGAVH
jgi:phosphoglycerol transferase MdoB-like AlkP superfamily enzyme